MTPQEYAAATAKLAAVNAEADALEQQVRDCINVAKEHSQKALEYVALRKAKTNARTKLLEENEPLRKAVEQHNIEAAAEQNKQRQAEAEANAAKSREAAEQAKAEEAAKEQSKEAKIDELSATVKRLEEKLAAKG